MPEIIAEIIPTSVFYATNKDILDLFMSSRREFKPQFLREFLARRGILVSRDEAFEEMARYLSSLELSSSDRLVLEEQLVETRRAEKMTVATIRTTMDAERLATIASRLAEKRAGLQEQFQPDFSSGSLELGVNYTEIDYGKTTLKQKRERDMKMEFVQNGDTLTIRRPANEKSDEILRDLVDIVADLETADPKVRTVDLSGLATPDLRNRFFTTLIRSLDGFSFGDVKGVWVSKIADSDESDDEDAAEDSLAGETGNESVETGKRLCREAVSQLSRALLEGTGVLGTRGYKSFISDGFSISWIKWVCKTDDRDEDLVKFEAGLQSPDTGGEFRYNICGVQRKREDGSYTNRQAAKPSERQRFFPVLEEAVWKVVDAMNDELRTSAVTLATEWDPVASQEATP